ncbi:MAG TPA: hypothetical protein VKV77_11435 [Methylovirgula sp.]|nr:hypothetical protein [Methylovirgula sp.]
MDARELYLLRILLRLEFFAAVTFAILKGAAMFPISPDASRVAFRHLRRGRMPARLSGAVFFKTVLTVQSGRTYNRPPLATPLHAADADISLEFLGPKATRL